MSWNPEVYEQFRAEREAPFADALALVQPRSGMKVVDLGCGTGALTARLAGQLPAADVTGIDRSPEMLAKAGKIAREGLRFEQIPVQEWLSSGSRCDLIFSNAALQWLPDHRILFPRLLGRLNTGGQLVVQMPSQHRNLANIILYQVAATTPFREAFRGYDREVSMLEPEEYAEILFHAGATDIQVFEKIYPVVVPDAQGVYDFINGSALRPYLAALDDALRPAFSAAFLERLREAFPRSPVFYPFKRILLSVRV